MKKINLYKQIKNMFEQEIKNGYVDIDKCDSFVQSLFNLQDDSNFEKNYEDGDLEYIFDKHYGYSIDSVENVMSLFKEQHLPIDYEDYTSIKYFLDDIETCNEYCYINNSENRIEKWEDSYQVWLEDVLEQTNELIKKHTIEREI